MKFDFVKDYGNTASYCSELNELASATFGGLSFDWWQKCGYWKEKYIPYSFLDEEGKIAANVSVNLMDVMDHGQRKHLIQLGTVMTAPEYRKQGLSRKLMEQILSDYKDKDGIYLFANDSAIDFYPRFGFKKSRQFQYYCNIHTKAAANGSVDVTETNEGVNDSVYNVNCNRNNTGISPFPVKDSKAFHIFEQIIETYDHNCTFYMDNTELWMYYLVNFMGDCVYYIEGMDTYVIYEVEDSKLILHAVLSKERVDLHQVIAICMTYAVKNGGAEMMSEAVLGFTPIDTEGFAQRESIVSDCTFYTKGDFFEGFGDRKLIFENLSHA